MYHSMHVEIAAGLESEQGSARRADQPPSQPHVGRSQIFVEATDQAWRRARAGARAARPSAANRRRPPRGASDLRHATKVAFGGDETTA